MTKCMICEEELKLITWTHLRKHSLSPKQYKIRFPNTDIGQHGDNFKEWRKTKSYDEYIKRLKITNSKFMKNNNPMKREEVKENHPTLFKKGHIPWNKGLTIEDERVAKNIKDCNFTKTGKHYPKISENHFTKKMTEEEKHNYFRDKVGYKGLISQQKGILTDIEKQFKDFLEKENILFVLKPEIFGLPDFLIGNNCIFIDGCFWHGCKECYPSLEKIVGDLTVGKVRQKDSYVTKILKEKDYKVIRIPEHELIKEGFLRQIIEKFKYLIYINKIKEKLRCHT